MNADGKFKQGQHVSTTAEYPGIAPRRGVVIGFSRDGYCVRIRCHGNRYVAAYHMDFWK